MSAIPMYQRPVPLDRQAHHDLRLQDNGNFGFARSRQTAVLSGAEFGFAIKEFPVVFTRLETKYLPVALLGLEPHQNLFVDATDRWTARYVPADLRRYPFVFARETNKPAGPLTVWIDEQAACLGRESGEPLFWDGKNSARLEIILAFLREFHAQLDATAAAVGQLAEAGLLSEKAAQITLSDGQRFNLTGFLTVDAEKLARLSQEAVYRLFQSGALNLAYLHLASLENLNHLLNLRAKRFASVGANEANRSQANPEPVPETAN